MLVLLLLLISSLINRSGLRISHSKVFSSGEHGYQCLIAIQQNMNINAWSRFSKTWISMLDRDSAEHGYQCLIEIQQNMDINAWSRFSRTWISMLDRDSAEHGYQCLIAIQQNMDINAWSRFSRAWISMLERDSKHSFDFRAVNLYLILDSVPMNWSRYQFEK